MTRLILRFLNAPGFILLVAFGVAIQTSLFASYPMMYLQPDVVLLATLWCALRRPFVEGGILTLIFSRIAEIHSGSPQGLFMIGYILVFLGVRASSRILVIPNLSSWVILTLAASLTFKGITLAVLHLMGLAANQWRHTLVLLFPGAVTAAATAVWVFRWLEKYDWVTYKNERARQLIEDEMTLEGEGI